MMLLDRGSHPDGGRFISLMPRKGDNTTSYMRQRQLRRLPYWVQYVAIHLRSSTAVGYNARTEDWGMGDPSLEEFAEVHPPVCGMWSSYTLRRIGLAQHPYR
jgi:hypothetical protein